MLNSLYEKAIAKRGFIHDFESETNPEDLLEGRWFDRDIKESSDDFIIAEVSIKRNFSQPISVLSELNP